MIFEVEPAAGRRDEYLDIAAALRPQLDGVDGFISIERFASISRPHRVLSLSFWRDDEAVAAWRNIDEHRMAQTVGRSGIFTDYRLRVAQVVRDYGLEMRTECPADSLEVHQASAHG